ncbi:hypothetical protein B0H13DRAFT_2258224, partial [Mycena leptocephala]
MHFCDSHWGIMGKFKEAQNLNDQVLPRTSPQLRRIVYLYNLYNLLGRQTSLFQIHALMDISWDELRMLMCPLRDIVDPAEMETELKKVLYLYQMLGILTSCGPYRTWLMAVRSLGSSSMHENYPGNSITFTRTLRGTLHLSWPESSCGLTRWEYLKALDRHNLMKGRTSVSQTCPILHYSNLFG